MFYAHIVLAKKGPFARIWLAAHWDKKLTKAHVFETNIEQSVEGIMQPKVKLALRTSGHLLLGIVRIYSRKTKYLLADCNEAFVKIKMAFRPGMVDLPEEHREAAVNAITLPEVFHDFDTALPELNDVDIEAQFSINQSRADEITMREEYGSLPMSIHDDGFGDMGFDADEADFIRDDPNIDENLMNQDLSQQSNKHVSSEPMPGTSRSLLELQDNDGFGDDFGQPAAGLFEGDLFADAPLERRPNSIPSAMEDKDSDDDMDGGWVGGAPSTPPSSPALSRPPSALAPAIVENADERHDAFMSPSGALPEANANAPIIDENAEDEGNFTGQTTLLNNEEESFALAPVDASALKGVTKAKRKRKLIVDEVKNISGEEMKSQLANTSDIITTLDLAPPTKRLMHWKDTGGVEKVFTLCTRDVKASVLFKNNQRHFMSRPMPVEDFSILGPADVLALEQHHNEADANNLMNKRGRKRKFPTTQEPDFSMEPGPAAREADPVSIPMIDNSSRFSDMMPPPPVTPCFSDIGTPSQPGLHSIPNIPMTPGSLSHGGITPSGLLHHGGMTPMNLQHGGMTPMHGGMTPAGLHSDFHSDLGHPAFTPAGLDHGGLTPHHGIENLDSIPNLPPDQVSSILNGTGMENMGFSNMGYDDGAHHTPQSGLSERIAEDWNHDYDFPPSVGPAQPGDEQMENETDEQFEERVLNKRAAQMFVSVRARMQKVDSIYLSEMTAKNNRKQAAQKFYSLLVLKKFQALDIKQDVAYGDILVTKGVMFDNPKL
ncbi:Double-strand-break repair protein rad21 like [Pseudolycoriella hygida]|uniref:Double-strand-break repair protein rad21 like n=1 Tax=Pseudolycoriella hygida TaxID=35572 RepID=A0A9Q0N9U5_9DIPT|nr:Double-strand-break repair protein rad21 like [Pseudolycoriella hygida]